MIVTTSKGLCAVPLVWRSGLRGKQTITTATTNARHKLSDSDSFSLSGWFATFKKKKHLIQLLTQGICQVVHVTPNLRSRFLSPSQRPTGRLSGSTPGWVATLSDCDVFGQRYADPGHTLVGI